MCSDAHVGDTLPYYPGQHEFSSQTICWPAHTACRVGASRRSWLRVSAAEQEGPQPRRASTHSRTRRQPSIRSPGPSLHRPPQPPTNQQLLRRPRQPLHRRPWPDRPRPSTHPITGRSPPPRGRGRRPCRRPAATTKRRCGWTTGHRGTGLRSSGRSVAPRRQAARRTTPWLRPRAPRPLTLPACDRRRQRRRCRRLLPQRPRMLRWCRRPQAVLRFPSQRLPPRRREQLSPRPLHAPTRCRNHYRSR